ncbi:MAG: tetratricopeptide repeat protein [Planctomycetota bacterium]|nr:tetratricopeptide repeat protein [Planctomycetota bacterium]
MGREREKRDFIEWLELEADGIPRAAMVVGSPGRGKTSLLKHFQQLCDDSDDGHIAQFFTLNQNEDSAAFLTRVVEQMHDVYAGTFVATEPDDRDRLRNLVKSFAKVFGPKGTALGEMLASLIRNKTLAGFQWFTEYLKIASKALKDRQRYVILIDPNRYLLKESHLADWISLAEQLPPRVRVVVAQRPDDVLAKSNEARQWIRQLPSADLGDLSNQEIANIYLAERREGRLKAVFPQMTEQEARSLAAEAFRKYHGYPIAHDFVLRRMSAERPADPISALATWPDELELMLDELLRKLASDKDQLGAMLSLASLGVPTPREIWQGAAGIEPVAFATMINTPAFKAYLSISGPENQRRYAPFHALFAERLIKELDRDKQLDAKVSRAAFDVVVPLLSERPSADGKDTPGFAFAVLAARPLAARMLNAGAMDRQGYLALLDRLIVIKKSRGLFDSILSDGADTRERFGEYPRAVSTAWNWTGDALMTRGDAPGALAAYTESMEIVKDLAAQDPDEPQWQRMLSVSSYERGNALHVTGKNREAIAAYRTALEIAEKLANRYPDNHGFQRDLCIQYNRLGDVLRGIGKTEEALDVYGRSMNIIEGLATHYPHIAELQRDLSVSLVKVADAQGDQDSGSTRQVRLERYSRALQILDTLAENSHDIDILRGRSVCYDRIGDIHRTSKDYLDARAAYTASMEIAKALADRYPANTEWQRDLAVSYSKLGLLARSSGETSRAREHWQRGRAIMIKLVALDPTNAMWKSDLANLDAKLAALPN